MNQANILERNHKLFINETERLPFLKGLANYLEHTTKASPFKEVFEQHLGEYEAFLKNIDDLEKISRAEMVEAKDTLLQVIKKEGLDINQFHRLQTHSFGTKTNLSEEFDAYLHGRAVGNGFRSDALQDYLFDIAANLLVLGHRDEIEKFLVSSEEYRLYYQQVNGPKAWAVRGNENGNFVFSKTWPKRWEEVSRTERERSLKTFGSFVKLSQFKRAYDIVSENKNAWMELRDDEADNNKIRIHDRIEIIDMTEELARLVDESARLMRYKVNLNPHISSNEDLDISTLKAHAQAAHSQFLQHLEKLPDPQGTRTTSFDLKTSTLYVKGKEFKIRRITDQYDLLRVIFSDPLETQKEWFLDEVAEKVDPAQSQERVKKYYNAAYQISRKLASKGVPEFFMTASKVIRINPDYLS